MKPGNEPAYPCKESEWNRDNQGFDEIAQGMTIRQEFVKAAMQGLLAHGFASAIGNTSEELATLSCEMADACLKKELETRV